MQRLLPLGWLAASMPWGAAALLAVLYTYFARISFVAGPTHDDLMNLHRAAVTPWPVLVRETLFFFLPSDQYRPVGALFYRVIYDIFGFNSWAFHAGVFVLWPVGLYFIYCFLRTVSGSRELAAFATLLNVHHSNRSFYYINVGLVYDVLCQLFYFAAAAYYVRIRQTGLPLEQKQLQVLSGLFILSLGSKEMAVTLPVLILAYELIFHGRGKWDFRFVALGGVMTAAFIAGRVFGPDGIGGLGSYSPSYDPGLYLGAWAEWLGSLLYHRNPLTLTSAAIALGALVTACWLTWDRTVRLGLILALAGVLPIAFSRPMRGLEAICIPTAGLACIAAWWITRFSLVFPGRWRAPVLFVLLAVVLADVHARRLPPAEAVLAEGEQINSVKAQLLQVHAPVKAPARVLFVKDPFGPEYRWGSTFLLQTAYGLGVQVDRADFLAATPDWAQYDYVFSWEGQRLVSLRQQAASSQ